MLPGLTRAQQAARNASPALKFVLMVGIMSFFADFTYEGSRSIAGPYLGLLGASAFAISVVSGAGEFLGYNIRLFSGRRADRTGRYWPITIGGYVLQMSVVPLLALAGNWQAAAVLIIAERIGKGIRNPPRDAMLSHAARDIGYGWAFGVHEALDQFGALFGPLLIALVLALAHHDYKVAFASLAVPAVIMLCLLGVARVLYPRPQDLAAAPAPAADGGLPRVFWIYLSGAALAAAGFADFPLIAYHFQRAGTVSATLTPVFYAVAMAVSGTGSLILGKAFDRAGIGVLIPLTIVAALYAPLAFLGGFWDPVAAGAALQRAQRRRARPQRAGLPGIHDRPGRGPVDGRGGPGRRRGLRRAAPRAGRPARRRHRTGRRRHLLHQPGHHHPGHRPRDRQRLGHLKSGAPARGERVAKYNRLLEIAATAADLRYGMP
jgi:MFS transporter